MQGACLGRDAHVVNEWKKVGTDVTLICPYKELVRIMPCMTHLLSLLDTGGFSKHHMEKLLMLQTCFRKNFASEEEKKPNENTAEPILPSLSNCYNV